MHLTSRNIFRLAGLAVVTMLGACGSDGDATGASTDAGSASVAPSESSGAEAGDATPDTDAPATNAPATDAPATDSGGAIADELSNLCDLLPAAAVEAALGEPVDVELITGLVDGAGNCNYSRAGGGQVRISYADFTTLAPLTADDSIAANREGFGNAGFDVTDVDGFDGFRYVQSGVDEPSAGIEVALDDTTSIGIDIQGGVDPTVIDGLFAIYADSFAG